jgi:hypothetical protein
MDMNGTKGREDGTGRQLAINIRLGSRWRPYLWPVLRAELAALRSNMLLDCKWADGETRSPGMHQGP